MNRTLHKKFSHTYKGGCPGGGNVLRKKQGGVVRGLSCPGVELFGGDVQRGNAQGGLVRFLALYRQLYARPEKWSV